MLTRKNNDTLYANICQTDVWCLLLESCTANTPVKSFSVRVFSRSRVIRWRMCIFVCRLGHIYNRTYNQSRLLVSSTKHCCRHFIGLLADFCLMALSAQTGYIMPKEYEIYYLGPGQTHNKTMKQHIKPKS